MKEVLVHFQLEGTVVNEVCYGNGHINDTYLVTIRKDDGSESRVILQRMNKSIFTKPVELMENIMNVTSFLRERIIEKGGDPDRETLNVIPTKEGKPYFVDSDGEYWRCCKFIENATSYDQVETPEDFYQSAVAFGKFQKMLADYPADTLHETIKGFHDTKARFAVFQQAVKDDVCGRAASVQEEIDFFLAHEEIANVFGDMLERGELPLRVTHNDTKLNNVMIDNETHEGICVLDLSKQSRAHLDIVGSRLRLYLLYPLRDVSGDIAFLFRIGGVGRRGTMANTFKNRLADGVPRDLGDEHHELYGTLGRLRHVPDIFE